MNAVSRLLRHLGANKSFQVAVCFVVAAITASFIPSPSWDGTLLDILPQAPPAFAAAPEEVDIASVNPAPVIDLPSVATGAGVDHPDDASVPAPEAADEVAVADTEAEGRPEQANPQDSQLREAINQLAGQLGEDRELLFRPCREEGPGGVCLYRELDQYFEKLRLVATREAEEPVRFSQFGDSMIMGDQFCGEFRRLMQNQFGDGGHGFMYPGNPERRFGFENIRLGLSDKWDIRTIVSHSASGGRLFGFAGAEFRPTEGPTFTMHAYDSAPGNEFERIGILYFAAPGMEEGSVFMTIDGNRQQVTFPTTPASSGIHWIEVPRGSHSITLSYFHYGYRYYGIISELSGPGVVVDNVGLVSSRMRNLEKIGEEHWRDQINLRDPDVISFNYGGNAGGQTREQFLRNEETYKDEYSVVLNRLRENNPSVECVIMGVLTRGTREGGRLTVYGAIPEIARAQREIANAKGCAFFDQFTFMGGAEGVSAWYNNSPQLLGSDLSHPTGAGYRELARAFYTELMYEFVNYLDERTARIAAGHPGVPALPEPAESGQE